MEDRRKITVLLSRHISGRLQKLINATGYSAETVVDFSLNMFFDGHPDAAIVEKLRLLDAAEEL